MNLPDLVARMIRENAAAFGVSEPFVGMAVARARAAAATNPEATRRALANVQRAIAEWQRFERDAVMGAKP